MPHPYELFNHSSAHLNPFLQGWEPETDIKAVVCLVHSLGEHNKLAGFENPNRPGQTRPIMAKFDPQLISLTRCVK